MNRFQAWLIAGVVMMMCLSLPAPTWARKDHGEALRRAQQLLNQGNYEAAFAEYRRAAEEKGNPLAQFSLGLFFRYGWGRPVDPAAACGWFEKAAAGKIPAATHFFAECLEDGIGRAADPAKAAVWYRKAAGLGHHMSNCSLAKLLMTGKGVKKDPAKALALCEAVAKRASGPAQLRMGLFYWEGDESIRDVGKAAVWFSHAARLNQPKAQYYLGIIHRQGKGQPQSDQKARAWFEQAASLGYRQAYLPAGELYFNAPKDPASGLLSAHDLAKAYLWLSAAARQTVDPEQGKRATELLKQVDAVMPPSWKPDLDAKVDAHFAEYPAAK